MQGITTIIFDVGGVLITPSEKVTPFILSELFQVPLEKTLAAYKAAIPDLRVGKMGLRDVMNTLREEYGSQRSIEELVAEYKKYYLKQALVDAEMADMARALSSRYTLVAFTNMIDLHIDCNTERGLFAAFADTIFSSKIGVAKPSPEAFARLLGAVKAPASACLFLDDKEENISQALAQGLNAYKFTTFAELTGYLQKEGLL